MSIEAMKQALDDVCGAKLCEINSMSSRAEMMRLMDKSITALRQAIAEAEKQEPVAELLKLMAEDGVTGVLVEVHRGHLSKSVRTWGDCSCPTHTDNDVTIEVQP